MCGGHESYTYIFCNLLLKSHHTHTPKTWPFTPPVAYICTSGQSVQFAITTQCHTFMDTMITVLVPVQYCTCTVNVCPLTTSHVHEPSMYMYVHMYIHVYYSPNNMYTLQIHAFVCVCVSFVCTSACLLYSMYICVYMMCPQYNVDIRKYAHVLSIHNTYLCHVRTVHMYINFIHNISCIQYICVFVVQ